MYSSPRLSFLQNRIIVVYNEEVLEYYIPHLNQYQVIEGIITNISIH